MIPLDTTHIATYLASGGIVMVTIQALKNLLPTIFASNPKLSQILAAVLYLVVSAAACLVGGKGIDAGCIVNAIVTFLSAIGIYHSVAQAGGSVQAPLPPAPKP